MRDTETIKGLDQLARNLDKVPNGMRVIARPAVRVGMTVIRNAARRNIRSESGELAAGLRITSRVGNGEVRATLRTAGPHAHVANWVEHGTAAHLIKSRHDGWLYIGGIFTRFVNHPGAIAKPFMRPAIDSEKANAAVAMGNEMKRRFEGAGLDTSNVQVGIEGDDS